jgi:hypothetical protein
MIWIMCLKWFAIVLLRQKKQGGRPECDFSQTKNIMSEPFKAHADAFVSSLLSLFSNLKKVLLSKVWDAPIRMRNFSSLNLCPKSKRRFTDALTPAAFRNRDI